MKVLTVIVLAFFLNLWLRTFIPVDLAPSNKLIQIGTDLVVYLIAFAPCYFIVFKLKEFRNLDKD